MYVYVHVCNVQDTLPAETDEFAVSVLVRTSMEEAGRPREAAIARGGTNKTTHHKTTIIGHEVLVYSYDAKTIPFHLPTEIRQVCLDITLHVHTNVMRSWAGGMHSMRTRPQACNVPLV